MADSHGPFDNANMGESGWAKIFDHVSGVLDDGLVATASGVTARGVDLSPGTVRHRGTHYTTDTSREVVSPENISGSPRIDRVVARVDTAANTMLPVVLEGTPGANPLPPSILDTDEPLWQWRVDDGAGAVSSLVDERTVIAGLVTSGAFPVDTKPGRIHFKAGEWRGWTGSAWRILHLDSGWTAVQVVNHWTTAPTAPLQVLRSGNVVNLRGAIRRGDTFPFRASAGQFERAAQLEEQFRPSSPLQNVVVTFGMSEHVMQCRVSGNGFVELEIDGTDLPPGDVVNFNMVWLVD